MSTRLISRFVTAGLVAGALATAAPANAAATPDAAAWGLARAASAIDEHRPYDAGTGRKVG